MLARREFIKSMIGLSFFPFSINCLKKENNEIGIGTKVTLTKECLNRIPPDLRDRYREGRVVRFVGRHFLTDKDVKFVGKDFSPDKPYLIICAIVQFDKYSCLKINVFDLVKIKN